MNGDVAEPGHLREPPEAEAQAEDHQAVRRVGEGQAIDLVLGDEDVVDRRAQGRELRGGDGQIREARDEAPAIEDAQT